MMPVFNLIASPDTYYPCREDMLRDQQFREYWLDHFIQHFDLTARLSADVYGPSAAPRAQACHAELAAQMEKLRREPALYGELNLQVLGVIRQNCLKHHDIADPYAIIKARENQRCVPMFSQVIEEVDALTSPGAQLDRLICGVFAGNIFDLGASATAHAFADAGPAFFQVRDGIGRPWLIDQSAAFSTDYFARPPRKACMFVDNAGSDVVLGMLPLARWLAIRGTKIVLLANEEPALNDITAAELTELLGELQTQDRQLAELTRSGQICAVSSGGATPLIDLRQVSAACNAACVDADFLLLEGMGRGLESNFETAFTVPCVKLCMIKEPIVAQRMGGKVFDVVFRYEP